MQTKKNTFLLIIAICYLSIIGIVLPYMIITLNWNSILQDLFRRLAKGGVFFTLYLFATLLFFPITYTTLLQEKQSHDTKNKKNKVRKPPFYAYILFVISIPIMLWLVVGIIGYYSVTDYTGGMDEFARNGFLTLFLVLLYYCIIPAIILSLKRGKNSLKLNIKVSL